jgi:hypothetical protein
MSPFDPATQKYHLIIIGIKGIIDSGTIKKEIALGSK